VNLPIEREARSKSAIAAAWSVHPVLGAQLLTVEQAHFDFAAIASLDRADGHLMIRSLCTVSGNTILDLHGTRRGGRLGHSGLLTATPLHHQAFWARSIAPDRRSTPPRRSRAV